MNTTLQKELDDIKALASKHDNDSLCKLKSYLKSNNPAIRNEAVAVLRQRDFLLFDIIEEWGNSCDDTTRLQGERLLKFTTTAPSEIINRWLDSDNEKFRIKALELCVGNKYIDFDVIKKHVEDTTASDEEKIASARACKGRTDAPIETIKDWAKYGGHFYLASAMCLQGRHNKGLILEMKNSIKKMIEYGSYEELRSISEVLSESPLPLEVLQSWQKDASKWGEENRQTLEYLIKSTESLQD